MIELMWMLYEVERADGSKETAELIGDAYTVLDMISMGNLEDGFALQTYYELRKQLTKDLIHGKVTGAVKAYRMLEQALTEAGMLEADEEPKDEEEDLNTSSNWDEWELDHMYDCYRDDRMAYEM